jgi:ATP synthase protein I
MTPDDPACGFPPPPRPDTSSNAQAPSAAVNARSGWSDLDTGTIIVAEFVSAVLTWGGIGWLLDRWLHTEPWLIALGLVIGTGAGFYLMYLRSHDMITSVPPAPRTGSVPDQLGDGAGGNLPVNGGAAGSGVPTTQDEAKARASPSTRPKA